MRTTRRFANRVPPFWGQAERGLKLLTTLHCALLVSSCLSPTSPTDLRLQEERRKQAEIESLETSGGADLHSMRFESFATTTAESCIAWSAPVQVKLLTADATSPTTASTQVTLEAFSDSSCSSILSGTLTAATLTVSTATGLATFNQVALRGSPRDIYLQARNPSGDVRTPCTGPIALTPGSEANVEFALSPSTTGISTVALGSQPRAKLSDACGNSLEMENVAITLGAYTNSACTSPAASGTLAVDIATVSTTGGAAAYSGVAINSGGTHYLGASAPGFGTACVGVTVTNPSPATSIAFQTAGSSSTDSCIPMATSPSVKVLNSIGAVDTTSSMDITLEAFSDSSCSFPSLSALSADQPTVAAASGIANFTNVKLTGALGDVYFRARNADSSLQTLCTGPVSVNRGAALLAYTSGPSASATAGIYLGTQPRVGFLDACLNPIINETQSAQLQVYDDASCTTPSPGGTMTAYATTESPVSGVASFSEVKIARSGIKYLGASAGSYQKACTAITVASNSAYRIAVNSSGSSSGTAGTDLAQVPVFEVQDAFSNRITSSSAIVALASFSDAACSLAYGGALTPASVTASSGLATPATLRQTKSGSLYIRGTSSGLQSICHGPIALSPGTANKLIFVTQPSFTANPGKNFTTQPVVAVADSNDNIVPTATPVDITLTAMSNATCTTTAGYPLTVPTNPTPTDAAGIAPFSGVQYQIALATLRVRATASGLTQACSSSNTNVAAGSATQLVFTQPAASQSQTAGTNFTTQPVIEARDADGNLANTYTGNITIAAFSDSACTLAATPNLTGTKTVAAVAGVSTYSGISHPKAGTFYIKATATNLTSACSPAHTMTPGSASKLAFTTQPSSTGVAGNPLINQPVVEVQDSQGNRIPGAMDTITLAAFTNNTCTIASTGTFSSSPTDATAGVAGFSQLSHTKAETIYIKASTGSLTPACSSAVSIAVGPASRLAFSTPPSASATEICTAFATQPTVRIEDAYGNTVTGATDSIQLSVATNSTCSISAPAGSVANATQNPKNATAGSATFAGVSVNLRGMSSASGVAYLKATSGSLDYACSPAVNLTASTTSLAFLSQPTAGTAGLPLGESVRVEVRDSCNQKVDFGSYSISILLTSDSGCYTRPPYSLTATATTVTSVAQTATFTNVTIPTSGNQYIRTTRTGTTAGCSGPIAISQSGASKLSVLTYPIQNQVNVPFAPTVSIGITDAQGNIDSSASNTVTLTPHLDSACSVPLPDSSIVTGNSLTSATSGGIAHFPGIRISSAGTYHFKASSPDFGTACTGAIDIHAAGMIVGSTDSSVCHLTGGGAILCWGLSSGEGRHGYPHPVALPQRLRGSSTAWRIASSTNTNCWVLTTGNVECIGYGTTGELGNGLSVTSTVPVRVREGSAGPDISNVIDLAGAGMNATAGSLFCALKTDGTVWCWAGGTVAGGAAGGLGDGTTGNSPYAVQVSGLNDALSIAVGDRYACAIRRTGTLACWGRNAYGNLGDTTTTQRATPVDVPGFDRVNLVAAQRLSTCALRSGGDLWCWGSGSQGGLALGGNNDFWSPRTTNFPGKFRSLSGNLYKTYMCGALSDGSVRCWGVNKDRMIGNSNLETFIYSPVEPFPGQLNNIRVLGSTTFIAYAVAEDGTVYSWGRSGNHSAGIGATGIISRPTDHTDLKSESNIIQLSVAPSTGARHLCVRYLDNTLKCTGGDQYGPVGAATSGPPKMTLQTILTDAIHASTSANSTCAVQTDGSVSCWGLNNTTASPAANGLLGVGSVAEFTSSPAKVNLNNLPTSGLVEVAQTDRATCVRRNNGTVWCWGENRGGQLGTNATGVTTFDAANAYQIPEITNAIKLAASSVNETGANAGLRSSFCALLSTGEIHCWGDNIFGGLGRNTTAGNTSNPTPAPAAVAGITDALDIKAGSGFYCARLTNLAGGASGSNLKCWGAGTLGQLGNGAGAHSSNPVSVNLAGNAAIDYALVFRGGCAILGPSGAGSTVRCWGEHNAGATGAGYISSSGYFTSPTLVPGVTGMDEIHGAGEGYLSRNSGNNWFTWGKNYPNQLYLNESSYSSLNPWTVQLPLRIAAGANHTCRVRLDGNIECWGSNSHGQLGIGSSPSRSETPTLVSGISNAYTIAAGGNHTCAAVAGGNVFCWGSDGVAVNSSTPVAVTWNGTGVDSQLQVSRIAAGENHTCLSYGWGGASPGIRGRCWGLNASGQLGNATTSSLTAPTTDLPTSTFNYLLESFALGKDHTCVQIRTGSLRCFGNNSLYQLNDGGTVNSASHMVPLFHRPLSMIAAGAYHTCGILSDFTGRIGCMGDNVQGQFGDSTSNGSSASKTFSYASGITTAEFGILAAGGNHTCTGLTDGTVRCWGLGNEGQLGAGAANSSLTPVATSALTGSVREIAAGEAHTCVRTSSAIQCFGRGTDGQLGQGAQSSSNSPVTVQINSL